MKANPTRAPRRGAEFLERVEAEVLVADGAMGTQIYERGVFINRCFDALSLSRPDLIREIHASYIEAGADLLETNTFGANRARLLGHGLETQVAEINDAAVRIAREAAGKRAFVAGSIGPIGIRGTVAGGYTEDDMRSIFGEQAEALLTAGVDILLVETIPALTEMLAALSAIRMLDSQVPVVALMTFGEDGCLQSGEGPDVLPQPLSDAGATLIGANCSVGPKPMLESIAAMQPSATVSLAAMPNAGLPQSVEGRLIYVAGPEYFGKFAKRFVQAGVRLLGGCCGTTPDHIRHMKLAVSGFVPGSKPADVAALRDRGSDEETLEPIRTAEKSRLAKLLADGQRFVTSVELTPPTSVDLDPLVSAVEELRRAGVDAVNIPEYARISPRPTPLAIARAIDDRVEIETIIHYCCRDRNLYGMQADLMAARVLDVRNVLIITGDPPKADGYAVPTAVFDVDAIGLVRVAHGLSRGFDAAGRRTEVPLDLHVGVGVNPGAVDLDRELERFHSKIDAGAEFAMTQPVFDAAHLERFLERLGTPTIPILVGILPLFSHRNAEFLHNEVPGMDIPAPIRERMQASMSREEGIAEGVAIAHEALSGIRDLPGVRGVYLMPPFGRYELALEVLQDVL